ncbi:uncharacterized protein ISCGN_013337 [Ixodes scapularis]
MVKYCSVPQCRSYATDPNVSFHIYPKEKQLRTEWLVKLRMGKLNSKSSTVCSKHFRDEDFVYAVGAKMFGWKKRTLAPGTVPSQNLPLRPLDKPPKLRQPLKPRAGVDTCKPRPKDDLPAAVTLAGLNSEEASTSEGLIEQELPNQDADAADPIGLQAELHTLKKDVGSQADTLQLEKDQVLGIARVKNEPALVSLTCIPCFQLFYNICDLYGESRLLSQRKDFSISNEDAVLLTMMKLYHNLTFSLLGVLFGVHRTTASNIFRASVPVLAAVLRHAVFWPEKEAVLQSLTKYFNKYRDCRMVLDCTEIPLQKPKNLESQLLTYSHYKGTHTAKVLVCETPGGLISYVSPAYCGRSSDTHITKESGLLEKCLPFIDSVMVDKGFLIDELCCEHKVKLVRPPFLRKNTQLSKSDAANNQSIAAARVHVERAIQRMKLFRILRDNFSADLLPQIDDVVVIIAGLVNLSKPLFSNDKFLTG